MLTRDPEAEAGAASMPRERGREGVREGGRERERERERERAIERKSESERERDRQTERQTERRRESESEREREGILKQELHPCSIRHSVHLVYLRSSSGVSGCTFVPVKQVN
jgi:hypothetical protein